MTIALLAVAATAVFCARPILAQQASRSPDKFAQRARSYSINTNEELQPTALPSLPTGMTVDMLTQGDQLFHGKGGCFACHGAEAQGLPAAGDGITSALFYARPEWRSIDSLIQRGIPDAMTRSPIAMPSRGARGNLTREEIRRVAAYAWAISQVRGEPWPGGHASHAGMVPPGSTKGTAPTRHVPSDRRTSP
jgi:mono/diheme cytochrome c family protein